MATSFGLGDEPIITGQDIDLGYSQEDLQKAVQDAGYFDSLDAPEEFSNAGAISQLEQDLMSDTLLRDVLGEEEALGKRNLAAMGGDILVDGFKKNLIDFEGNYGDASFAHKPSLGSGITIAQGLDAIGSSRAKMKSYGVPERVLLQLDGFDAFTKGKDAVIPKNASLERLTRKEFDTVSKNIAKEQKDTAIDLRRDYPQISDKGVGILLSLKHWAGSYKSGKESKLTRWSDNLAGQKSETGVLVSPIKDILDNPEITDQDLIDAMDYIRTSYVPWGEGKDSLRYQTLSKYIDRLTA